MTVRRGVEQVRRKGLAVEHELDGNGREQCVARVFAAAAVGESFLSGLIAQRGETGRRRRRRRRRKRRRRRRKRGRRRRKRGRGRGRRIIRSWITRGSWIHHRW